MTDMKKKFITTIAFTALLMSPSCEDFLTVDPMDKLVVENFYNSEESVRANTASLYGRVWFDFISNFMYFAGDMMSGDMLYTYSDEGQFFLNTVQPGNQFSLKGWNSLYLVISYANSIINDIPAAASQGGVSKDVINRALGEAYCFRALAYYYLTEYWKEVPIIKNSSELITSGNINDVYVNKNTQGSLYRFMCEDLLKAVELLPESDSQAGRVNKYSAMGLLSKVYLTRGCYVKGGGQDSGESGDYFKDAQKYALRVIEEGPALAQNYSTLYDVAQNNNSESLIAFQSVVAGYGFGSSRSTTWSRRDALTGAQCWGAGKTPTVSLQEEFEKYPNDGRRKWVYMRQGDHYPMLNDYTYMNYNSDLDDYSTWTDQPSDCLAHLKKYVINSEGGKFIGTGQDAANNIYFLRLSDIYFVYAEALLEGDLNGKLTDATAIGYINQILNRGGDSDAGYNVMELSYLDIIRERRKEFAMESCNWFDIKRLYYLDGATALDYLNKMYRDRVYKLNYSRIAEELGESYTNVDLFNVGNKREYYVTNWYTRVSDDNLEDIGTGDDIDTSNRAAAIIMNDASMYIAIPSDATTKAPILLEPAVDYYAN